MQIPDALPTSTPLPDRDDRLSAVVGSLSELRSLSELKTMHDPFDRVGAEGGA